MLTAADLSLRETGIGASEIAAVLELDPYKGPLDVWLRKRTPRRGPLLGPSDPGQPAMLGHAIEPVLRRIYVERTGNDVAPTPTTRHADLPFVLATADGLGERSGLEIKVVGMHMAHHWGEAGDDAGLPDYVRMQVAQNMAVFDRDRWDVCALIGGTDLRLWTIDRDAELEASLLEASAVFWEEHVLADEPPPPPDRMSRREYMRQRYPGSNATACRQVGDDAAVAELMMKLGAAKEAVKLAEAEHEILEAALCGIVGDDYGIEGIAGKFIWFPQRGRVNWKAVAEELAGGEGKVPPAVQERHRGEGFRATRLSPPKDITKKGRSRR